MAAFEEMGVMPELIRAVEELGWQCAPGFPASPTLELVQLLHLVHLLLRSFL